jgi:hypothetical protein
MSSSYSIKWFLADRPGSAVDAEKAVSSVKGDFHKPSAICLLNRDYYKTFTQRRKALFEQAGTAPCVMGL